MKVWWRKSTGGRRHLDIGAAIQKYGWENFSVEIIEECTIEQLDNREIFWIAALGSKALNG
ncbi:MAG: hypothetical protein II968_08105 [Selenomonadaceae bacterium]|nr:hypothetical protein [Selenomonadaceae bacterium]MBQ4495718.1 hypothetical protein [Selenomonadaceae bacterium]MBQ6759045.1 hypothetical protein [Selenomonadaceae bacterium]